MGFSRQEYQGGLPFPSPGDLPDPGIRPGSPALQAEALPSEPPGKPSSKAVTILRKLHNWVTDFSLENMYQHLQDNFLNFKKTHQITVRTIHFKEADSQPEMVFSQEFSFHISIASDMQMTPPLWQKVKRNKRTFWWKWKRRVEKLA